MENDVPTLQGTTPDSEENNNSSAKVSPGPSTVISEPVGQENDEQSEGARTPLSTGNDVNNESPDGDVTTETKLPPEEKTTLSEIPNGKSDELIVDPDSDTGKEGIEGHGKDSGLGGSVGTEEKGKEGVETQLQNGGVESPTKQTDDQAVSLEQNSEGIETPLEHGDGENTEEKVETTENEHVGDVKEDSKDIVTVDEPNNDSDSSKVTEEKQDNEAPTLLDAEEVPKDSVELKPIEVPTAEECSTEGSQNMERELVQATDPGDSADMDQSGTVKKADEAEEDETPLSHEDLLTRYHATELQLDGTREDNAKLTARIEELEKEVKQLKEGTIEEVTDKQKDGYRVHADFLARELSTTQDAEQFLKEKVAELLEEKEQEEKKIRDLQLRLKRFVKDDRAKDERIASMEAELKEVTGVVEELEAYVDEETRLRIKERRSGTRQSRPTMSAPTDTNHTKEANTNRSYRDPEPVVRSRTCVMF